MGARSSMNRRAKQILQVSEEEGLSREISELLEIGQGRDRRICARG